MIFAFVPVVVCMQTTVVRLLVTSTFDRCPFSPDASPVLLLLHREFGFWTCIWCLCSRCIRLRTHAEVHIAPKPFSKPTPLTPNRSTAPSASPGLKDNQYPEVPVKVLSLQRVLTASKGACRARFVRGDPNDSRKCMDTCPAARVNPCTLRALLGASTAVPAILSLILSVVRVRVTTSLV